MNRTARLGASLVLCSLAAMPALAITRSWSGQAGNSWSTAANWNPAGVPAPSDTLVFPAFSAPRTINVDVPAGTSVGPMTFNESYTMTGNSLTLTGDVTINKSVSWNANVKFGAPLTLYTNSGALTFNGAVDASASMVMVYNVHFDGTLTGSGNIATASPYVPLWIAASGNFNGAIVNGGAGGTINPYFGNLPDAAVRVDSLVWIGTGATVGDLTVSTLRSNWLFLVLHTKSLRFGGGDFNVYYDNGQKSLVQVNGAVTLTGGRLVLNTMGHPLEVGQSLTIIDNDGSDPVIGTFDNLPEGGAFYLQSAGGTHKVSYHGGDGNDVVITRMQDKFTLTKVTQSSSESNAHNPVTFTATVTALYDPSSIPTGQVAFYFDNNEQIPYSATLQNGVASYTIFTLPPGTHAVSARYLGNVGFSYSFSPPANLSHAVFALSVATISSLYSSALYGHSIPFIVNVGSQVPGDGQPTGFVAVLTDGSAVGGGTLKSGAAAFGSNTPTHVGTHSFTAVYIGDSRFRGTTSAPISITIDKMTTKLDPQPQNPMPVGASSKMKVVIAPTSGNGEINSGNLTVKEGTNTLAAVEATSGSVDVTLPPLALGQHTLQVAYGGTADFEPSSASVTLTVANAPKIFIHGTETNEGNSGLTPVSIAVTLSEASTATVRVSFHTVGGSATEGVDYEKASGVIEFAPGEQTKSIELHVFRRHDRRGNRTFSIILSDPVNAWIETPSAIIVIIYADAPPGRKRSVRH